MKAENIQLFAELTMIALGRFLQHVEIRLKIFFLLKSSAVNTLEHFIMFIAAPVRAGDTLQLHRFHLAGGKHMRPRAEIDEIPLLVKRNDRPFRQAVDKLDFIALSPVREKTQRVGTADLLAHQRQILLDNAFHLFLDVF